MPIIKAEERNVIQTLIDNSGLKENHILKMLGTSRTTYWRKRRAAHTFGVLELKILGDLLHKDWSELGKLILKEYASHPHLYVQPKDLGNSL